MRFSHILVQQKFEAEDIQRLLSQGKSFSELAKKFSTCSSALAGGDLGETKLSRLDPDFAEAAQDLKLNEISGIVKTRFGYHLIRRDS